MKLLAVDDNPYFLQVLRLALTAGGYRDITLAENVVDAEQLISGARQPFDLFLLDIQMPGKIGLELCRKIRSDEHYTETSIIIMTAMSEKRHLDQVFESGANAYLSKPFRTDELHARVDAAKRNIEDSLRSLEIRGAISH